MPRSRAFPVRFVRTTLLPIVLLILPVHPPPLHAQDPMDRGALRVEASFLAGSVAYAVRSGSGWFAGGAAGGGIDRIHSLSGDHIFGGSDWDYSELVHLAGFVSWTPSPHLRTDMGIRASVVLYGDADSSATHFLGPYIAPAVGWRLVKAGSRIQAGWSRAGGVDGLVIFFQPLVVSWTLPR